MNYHVRMSDGIKIAVYDPNPQGKMTVLLIHGWPLSHKIFEYQVHLLCCCDCRVITLDLRGFGDSDRPAFGYHYDRMAMDILQVVKVLGIKEFILGGFSMGGAIVLRYMRLFQGYGVKKLMLFAAAAPSWTKRKEFPYGKTREQVDDIICQISADQAHFAWLFSHEQLLSCPHSEAVKDWFWDIAMSASLHGTIQTAIALRDEDCTEDLKAVSVPTGIFQGNYDIVVPTELTMYQYQHIKGAVMYQLPNSGHGVMYDELVLFNDFMLDFIFGKRRH